MSWGRGRQSRQREAAGGGESGTIPLKCEAHHLWLPVSERELYPVVVAWALQDSAPLPHSPCHSPAPGPSLLRGRLLGLSILCSLCLECPSLQCPCGSRLQRLCPTPPT